MVMLLAEHQMDGGEGYLLQPMLVKPGKRNTVIPNKPDYSQLRLQIAVRVLLSVIMALYTELQIMVHPGLNY